MTRRLQAPARIVAGDREAPLLVRRSTTARRLLLRVDPAAARVVLTLPRGASLDAGLRFLAANEGWVARQLAAVPPGRPFADGALIPLRGQEVRIRHAPGRGTTHEQAGELVVHGAPEHLPRRVRDYLVAAARAEFSARAHALAARIGAPVRAVGVRDARSRWGSCASGGRLSFSWRIVMAPDPVRAYLVAHEVAHLRHMDHSPSFWRLVRELCPEAAAARLWLRRHGMALHRVGATSAAPGG